MTWVRDTVSGEEPSYRGRRQVPGLQGAQGAAPALLARPRALSPAPGAASCPRAALEQDTLLGYLPLHPKSLLTLSLLSLVALQVLT